MVMVAAIAKRALWGVNTALLQSLAVGDMHREPTTVEVTLDFRGNTNKMPAKSAHNKCSEYLYITPFGSPYPLSTLLAARALIRCSGSSDRNRMARAAYTPKM